MTANRSWALLTVVAGAAMLGSGVASATLAEVAALGDCAVDGAVIRYELARSSEDLAYVFGAEGEACRSLRVAAMDALNRVDLYWFVPAYALFLVFGGLFLGGARVRLAIGAGALVGFAAVLDVFETVALLDASPAHAPDAEQMSMIYWFATGKFALLAVNAVVLAWLAWSHRTIAARGVAVLQCLGAVATAAIYIDLDFIPMQTLLIGLAWIGLLVFAAVNLLARRPVASAA